MKNLKLDVLRFESDDIMTTSCNQTVFFFKTRESSNAYSVDSLDLYKREANSSTAVRSAASALRNGTLTANTYYHVTEDGTIEVCPTPENHTASADWFNPNN